MLAVAATGGAAAPLLIAVGAGAAGGGVGRLAAAKVIQGQDYTPMQGARDTLIGAVDGAGMVLGGRAAVKLVRAATTAQVATRGAIDGGVGGALAGAAAQATEKGAWDNGATPGLQRVAKGAIVGATIGAAVGAVTAPTADWVSKRVQGAVKKVVPQAKDSQPALRHAAEIPKAEATPAVVSDSRLPDWEPAADGLGEWRVERGKGGVVTRRRMVGEFLETDKGNGVITSWRQRIEDGITFSDYFDGKQLHITATQESLLAKAATNPRFIEVGGPAGPMKISVNGATDEELEAVRQSLEAMPLAARCQGDKVAIVDKIGEHLDPTTGNRRVTAGRVGPDGRIVVSRDRSDATIAWVLQHETGHNLDRLAGGTQGPYSARAPWGNGTSVSKYGLTSAAEDFAETNRVVLEGWERYKDLGATGWAQETDLPKKIQIARILEAKVPPQADVDAAVAHLNPPVGR